MSDQRVATTRRPSQPPRRAPSLAAGRLRRRRFPVVTLALLLTTVATAYAVSADVRAYAARTVSSAIDLVWSDASTEPLPHRQRMIEAAELFYRGEWTKATAIYERLVAARPEDPEIWYGVGLCRHHFGRYEDAIEANRRAMADPKFAPRALYNLATEYALTDRPDRALEALEGAFRLGFMDVPRAADDHALDAIRHDPRFQLPPEIETRSFTTRDGATIDYALVLPRDFDPSKTYPALLALPGSRQDTAAVNLTLENYWGMQAHYRGWIVISPLANRRAGFAYHDEHRNLPALLDHIERRFNIEGGRFHLAGYSNGGTASFRVAVEFPDRFHSITTLPCYEISEQNLARLEVLDGIPITLFYGELDRGPSPAVSRRIHERLTELGLDSTLTAFHDEPHTIGGLMGERFMTHMETLRLRRRPDPTAEDIRGRHYRYH